MNSKALRIIDANANRLREAFRVCEDIMRFILQDRKLTREFKLLRHKTILAIKKFDKNGVIITRFRDSEKDVGKRTIKNESRREDISEVFKANIKRAEESARVLEEFSKLLNKSLSNRFKDMRFKLYTLEKRIAERL